MRLIVPPAVPKINPILAMKLNNPKYQELAIVPAHHAPRK